MRLTVNSNGSLMDSLTHSGKVADTQGFGGGNHAFQ
jgi:hypothetical protein